MRAALGVIIGYVFFVVMSLAFFRLSGQKPHADASTGFMIITAVYGIVIAFIAGVIAQTIAGNKTLTVNYILAIILAGFAAFSIFKSTGSSWTQLMSILLFTPASIWGGWVYLPRR